MRISQNRIVFLLGCAVFFLGAGAQTAFAAQSSKTKAASEQKTSATVDLNSASEKDLDNLLGVGPSTAKKIIAGRPYSSVDDLSKAIVSAATIKSVLREDEEREIHVRS
jgi:DNA uptake protein ComE-like DNA-binding protein